MEGIIFRPVYQTYNKLRTPSLPLLPQLERIVEQDGGESHGDISPVKSGTLDMDNNEYSSALEDDDDTSLVAADKGKGQIGDSEIAEGCSRGAHITFEFGENIDSTNTEPVIAMDDLHVEPSENACQRRGRQKRSQSVPILVQLDTILEQRLEEVEETKQESSSMATRDQMQSQEDAVGKHSKYKSYYAVVASPVSEQERETVTKEHEYNHRTHTWRSLSAPALETEQFYWKERPSSSCSDSHHVILPQSRSAGAPQIHRRESGPAVEKPLFGDALKADILNEAVLSGDASIVRYLLQQGIDPNGYDQMGWPILHTAVVSGNFDCAVELIEFGADLDYYTELVMAEYAKVKQEYIANCSTLV